MVADSFLAPDNWQTSPERAAGLVAWKEHLKGEDPQIAVVTYTYADRNDYDDIVHRKSGALWRYSKAFKDARNAFRRRVNGSPWSETT